MGPRWLRFFLGGAVLAGRCAAATLTVPTVPDVTGTLRIAGVGDVMVHQSVKHSALASDDRDNNAGWNHMFEDVADVLNVADVSFANLETPLLDAPTSDPYFLASGQFPLFKAPPELAAALKWANFHVVSVANNHSFDQGEQGIASTVDAVRKAGLVPIGAGHTRELAEAPELISVRGMTVGFLGATEFLNIPTQFDVDDPQVAVLNGGTLNAFCERVRELKSRVDLVVLSIHWGEEEMTRPRDREVELAHALCEAGVDVILGHHPHVLQPIETFPTKDGRTAVIAYSLGNFVTGNPKPAWRAGAIVIFEAGRGPDGKVRLTTCGYVPTWCTASFESLKVTNIERMIRAAQVTLEDPTLTTGRRAAAQEQLAHYQKQLGEVRRALGPAWRDLTSPDRHDKKDAVVETPGPPRP